MAAVPFKFTTTASTNLTQVRLGTGGNIKGLTASNASTTALNFLKLYWFTPTASAPTPVVGTTVPSYTIPLAFGSVAGAGTIASWPDGITGNGQLWVAVTGAAADNDSTNATAGCVISLNVE